MSKNRAHCLLILRDLNDFRKGHALAIRKYEVLSWASRKPRGNSKIQFVASRGNSNGRDANT